MCGIFGIIRNTAGNDIAINSIFLRNLYINASSQGKGANGYLVLPFKKASDISHQKAQGTEFIIPMGLNVISYLLGHARSGTVEDSANRENIHPIYSGNRRFCVLHNGGIDDYNIYKYLGQSIPPRGTVDTKALSNCLQYAYDFKDAKSLLDAGKFVIHTLNTVGNGNWAMMVALDVTQPHNILFARYGGASITFRTYSNFIVFATKEEWITNAIDETNEKCVKPNGQPYDFLGNFSSSYTMQNHEVLEMDISKDKINITNCQGVC